MLRHEELFEKVRPLTVPSREITVVEQDGATAVSILGVLACRTATEGVMEVQNELGLRATMPKPEDNFLETRVHSELRALLALLNDPEKGQRLRDPWFGRRRKLIVSAAQAAWMFLDGDISAEALRTSAPLHVVRTSGWSANTGVAHESLEQVGHSVKAPIMGEVFDVNIPFRAPVHPKLIVTEKWAQLDKS